MLLHAAHAPLELTDAPVPKPAERQVLLQVAACGVCRTDLHIVDGELEQPKLPLVLGHEIVATVVERGPEARQFEIGERVGVPWLGWTDQTCRYCRRGQENLCDAAQFTGYTLDGGYAELRPRRRALLSSTACQVRRRGSRAAAVRRTDRLPHVSTGGESAERIGIYGFGAAAHIVAQVAVHDGRQVYAFTRAGRPGDASTSPEDSARCGRAARTNRHLTRWTLR